MTEVEKELSEKWTKKHLQSGILSDSYNRLGFEKKAQRVFFCGTDLQFKIPLDRSSDPKLHKANFCKDRLCGMCAWRRSLKIFGQVSQVMEQIKDKYAFIFVSYTIRNVSATELKNTIKKMFRAYYSLHRKKTITRAFKGYFRGFEITRNTDLSENLEYHPHIHAIYAVNKSYFKNNTYINNRDLAKMWANEIDADYYPQVRMERITPEKAKKAKTLKGAVAEVTKYTLKSSDILRGSEDEIDRTVRTLMDAIASVRLCAFGGIMKKIAHELDLDDLIDGDLTYTDQKELRPDVAYIIANYKWSIGYGYYLNKTWEETNENL